MTNNSEQQYFWQEKLENNHIRLGLSPEGQDEVGEVSFVDFPDDLKEVQKGDPIISVEGAKSVTELEAPIAGKVAKVNVDLLDHPEKINNSDHDDNWIIELY
ncbi:glycine cleavage system protein H [Bombilactobacillus bombi]|uniref:glycine cleavage system protein H n=1 Tax=Bombilactobacillus bombi TaxID=1303590 RepID=UPI00215A079A|nr:glycine cleavage system protein H [Bombilactobacillus bombi]